MGVRAAIRAGNGVINYLNKYYTIGKPKSNSFKQQEVFLNNLLLKFGKENNIKLMKNNASKYKGNFSPFMANCMEIQEHWSLFTKWLKENYESNVQNTKIHKKTT